MKNFVGRLLFLLPLFSFVASCGNVSEDLQVGNKVEPVKETVLSDIIEPVKSKLDVYDSMARATKYNVVSLSQHLHGRVFDKTLDKTSAEQIISDIKTQDTENKHALYSSLRALDFAVLFAGATVRVENAQAVDDVLYKKSAESLTLGAIKSHKDVLFAHSKNREISKLISREQKNIDEINSKFEKTGRLNDEDVEYVKSLEVIIYKLNEVNSQLARDVENYSKLIKADEKAKLSLEGRQFYELEDFDKSLTIDLFQRNAINSSVEFVEFINKVNNYSFSDVENVSLKKYPELERLIVNGYKAGEDLYWQTLQKRADKVSLALIRDTKILKSETNIGDIEEQKKVVARDLAIAIFAQIEMAYNIVHINDLAIFEANEKLKVEKNKLRDLEKVKKDDRKKHLGVLNEKLSILEQESALSRLKADREIAIRALYFYSGYEPFNRDVIGSGLKELSREMKIIFNQNLIEMLARVKTVEKEPVVAKNSWAKKDNWLEELVVDGKSSNLQSANEPAVKAFLPEPVGQGNYYTQSDDVRKTMQLGAFADINNVNNAWESLYANYPDIRGYIPEVSSVSVGGVELHRLIIRSEKGGLVSICNQLKQNGLDCFLR